MEEGSFFQRDISDEQKRQAKEDTKQLIDEADSLMVVAMKGDEVVTSVGGEVTIEDLAMMAIKADETIEELVARLMVSEE